MNNCSCKNQKWECNESYPQNVVTYKGENWHFDEKMHWNDGKVSPGLFIIEGELRRTKRLHE